MPRTGAAVFASLAGTVCGMTLLYLSMRSVMSIGGACADGNAPYVSAQPCPEGMPLALLGGIFGGLICFGVYLTRVLRHQLPSLVPFAWSALFLSLGWNFLEFGLRPPGAPGVEWGWLVCAGVFFLMGGAPLPIVVPYVRQSFRDFAAAPPVSPAGPRAPRTGSTPRPSVPAAAPVPGARGPGTNGAPAAGPRHAGSALVTELERLAELHTSGTLDESEFRLAKQRILNGADRA